MTKKFWAGLLMASLIFLVAGCGTGGKTPEKQTAENKTQQTNSGTTEKKVLRLGTHLPDEHSVTKTGQKLAELVAQKSNGKIEIKVFPNGTIGDQRALVEGMQLGTIDMSINDAGLLSNFDPKWGICDLPYLWKSYEHVRNVEDGEVGKTLQQGLLSKGIRSLGWMDSGFRNLFVNKEIRNLQDLKGMKIRVPEAPVYVKTFQLLGANPTVIPWGEVYTSLQTKVVEGFEQPNEATFTNKMYEVTKYIVKTGHLYTVLSINISEKTWQKLSPEEQKIIADAAKEASAYGRKLAEELDSQYGQKLVEKGMKVIEVNKDEFQKAVQPLWKEYGDKVGANDLIQKIVEAGK
ncbi:TRAP dicarboxylate transporter [Moorella glycerini]|uniref:2,3-diketo-L-gulonate-binding periplasmic protein YiaO n=1 Tax=Neomoorella stamsii TaxID=1266720 RepID=A0A9X7J2P4_9FIRM|nr:MULTISPECIES: TRAP transporter substrate-binding protein [Moorella]PRR72361.1 2,3-diketo-L-gulonate-binding periplasmic protein YiaO precursor [Moorella stamsii]CEP67370.1 TRAP dicarboxylate transporter [Moorella glycerini]